MKPLELTIYPKAIGRHGEPVYVDASGEWTYPVAHVDGYAVQNRFTDAELAAEYYRSAFLWEGSLSENDGYDGMPETRAHRNQATTLWRFATLPHYDEATQ